jgi:hypothetical protein
MLQDSSLYPRLIDSNSIYCLLYGGEGYELLLNRIKEDIHKGGVFGNKGNCCLIPETKEILLSSSAVRDNQEARDLIYSFEEYNYQQVNLIREEIEKKRREITTHPDCQLNLEDPSEKEILYLAAVSLIIKGTIVTNNLQSFNQVEKNLSIEDWTYEKEVICVRDNKPGLLYKVSRLIGENDIDIISATNQRDRNNYDRQDNFEFVVKKSFRDIPLDIKRRLANVKYIDEDSQTKILFNHLRRKNSRTPSEQILMIRGTNRTNLLADIAYVPFCKNYNILVSNSKIIQSLDPNPLFSIGFVFDANLSREERLSLENELRQTISNINSVDFTDYQNTLVN